MSDDIVARLRDYYATVLAAPPYYRELTQAAADEIERLRDLIDGYHYTAMGQNDWIKRLQKERDEARREVCGFAASDIDRAGRIEVKGLVSGLLAVSRKPTRPVDVARSRNWDCFKEESNEG